VLQNELNRAGLPRRVDDPTPFERDHAGSIGPGGTYRELADPKSGDVVGYVHSWRADYADHAEVLKRDGTTVWTGTTGEQAGKSGELSPLDVVPWDAVVGLGVAATKAGIAALRSAVGKAIAESAEQGLAEAAGGVTRTAAADVTGKLAGDVSGEVSVDVIGKAGARNAPASGLAGTGVPRPLGPIAGATEVGVTPGDYYAALSHVFPEHYLNPIARAVDGIGERAAQRVVANPRFVEAVQNGQWPLAGTLFHSAAAQEARALPSSAIPSGWSVQAERVVQAGAGGSRADLLLSGPANQLIEFDWKTSGASAISSASRKEMTRHAGQISVNVGGTLVTQESRSWIDFVRPLLPGIEWP
jgi:hypothetical protein